METIGKRLKHFVAANKVSVADLSEKTGIPEPSLYRLFNSEGGLNSTTLAKLIEQFPNLNITWLITGNGNHVNRDDTTHANEEREPYLTKNDAELKTKVRTILSNDVVLDVLVEILKRYEK